jgi:hypothetical protein
MFLVICTVREISKPPSHKGRKSCSDDSARNSAKATPVGRNQKYASMGSTISLPLISFEVSALLPLDSRGLLEYSQYILQCLLRRPMPS